MGIPWAAEIQKHSIDCTMANFAPSLTGSPRLSKSKLPFVLLG